jgi:hypothetical protein
VKPVDIVFVFFLFLKLLLLSSNSVVNDSKATRFRMKSKLIGYLRCKDTVSWSTDIAINYWKPRIS